MGKDGGQGKFFPKYFDKRLACHLNSLCTCIMLIPQSCPTLCNFMDYSLSDSSVHGILQERILAAAAAKSLQSCLTLCNPRDSSPPGSPSLGFSRQEFWSGLQFPFPMHESEKWKWSRSVVSDPQGPHGLQPTRLLHPWDFPGKSTGVGCHCLLWRILEWVAFPPPGNLPNPGIEPKSPAFQADYSPSETLVKLFLKINKYYF